MNDRIRLAEAIGWRRGRVDTIAVMGKPISAQRWIDRDGNDRGPTALPDPFTDANDDYAVLEWMRENYENWTDYCDTLFSLQMYCEEYHIGNYARAALKVLDTDREGQ